MSFSNSNNINLLDFKKLTLVLSVTKLINSSLSIPFFSPNRVLGFNKLIDFLKISLNKVTLTLSPDFFNFPFSLASEK